MLLLFGGTITQPLNDSGAIEPTGTLTFYLAGTLTPKAVYHDAAGGSPWTNPVTLDGNGRAVIFLAQDAAYDIVFKDHNGTTVWTLESVLSPAPAL